MRSHPAPLFPVITIGPFTKWGVDYMTCSPISARGNKYIIVVVDYFMKWEEAMPNFKFDGDMESYLFLSNDMETCVILMYSMYISRNYS